ncbi:MAG: alpha-glucan family phosphorylase, partial [Verrucomicrobiota bacterium]
AVMGLRLAARSNGVAALHGSVSRSMFAGLWPDVPLDEVPITSVTNGVHAPTWVAPEFGDLLSRYVLPEWDGAAAADWARVEDARDDELWRAKEQAKDRMISTVRQRLAAARVAQGMSTSDVAWCATVLDPRVLTIGFARRFATYKRAPLIFDQFENIVKLVRDTSRPVQFIFAGKAHPRDDEGKRFIQKIIHLSNYSELKGHLVFLENYDIHVCRQMVSGCDIWLNNPRRPLEASGTSGMKATAHGCLNMSILDGWWREGYDGTNGFAIGPDSHPADVVEQDRVDSANLFRVLTEEVVPTFFNRDAQGIPRQWIARIRRALTTLAPQYSTWRMVQEYTNSYYLPHVK